MGVGYYLNNFTSCVLTDYVKQKQLDTLLHIMISQILCEVWETKTMPSNLFVGRNKELAALDLLFNKKSAIR